MSQTARPQLVCARRLLCRTGGVRPSSSSPARVLRDAGLLVSNGVIQQVAVGHQARKRLQQQSGALLNDLGQVCLMPGLVNAHAHLELTGLEGLLPREGGFGNWVRELLAAKAEHGEASLVEAAAGGLTRALLGGSTTVGDVTSGPTMLRALAGLGGAVRPRIRLFREVLDAWDLSRTQSALAGLEAHLDESPFLFEGYSPHAPFTTSRELLEGLASLHARRPRPLTVHWAETQAELDWMEGGRGEFQAALGASPKMPGLRLLEQSGLLGPWTSLVHGNLPANGEIKQIAELGASLIHCPGTHAFFNRKEFPLQAYLAAGVNVALGTDSLASNDNLNLVVEAKRLLLREPSVGPLSVLAMATEAGAQALGLGDRIGQLEVGFFADALVLPIDDLNDRAGPSQLVEHLLADFGERAEVQARPLKVLIGGDLVPTA